MKRLMVAVAFGAILALAVAPAPAAELPAIPPMPEKFSGIKIVTPDPSVPKEIADFLGEWEGVWKGAPHRGKLPEDLRRAKVIIYEVSADKAKTLYGIGDSPHRAQPGGWFKEGMDIKDEGGKKRLSYMPSGGSGFNRTYHLEGGMLIGGQGIQTIEMKRVK